jgi:hypothetical protein
MTNAGIIAMSILGVVLAAPVLQAPDLSRYRQFQFGTRVPLVTKQAQASPSHVKVIHRRPAVIQELVWDSWTATRSSTRSESVKDIRFSFLNGVLFRMVVNYDNERTEGLTADDIIDAISTKYGSASRPVAEITLSSTQTYSDGENGYSNQSEKVIARWEDAQYSFNLVRTAVGSAFVLVMSSKRLNELAEAAVVEAIRLDEQEAPQRELDRQTKRSDENRVQQEKARLVNKVPFRP